MLIRTACCPHPITTKIPISLFLDLESCIENSKSLVDWQNLANMFSCLVPKDKDEVCSLKLLSEEKYISLSKNLNKYGCLKTGKVTQILGILP